MLGGVLSPEDRPMAPHEQAAPSDPEPPPAKLIRIPLRDLPMTPELERYVEDCCRFFGRYKPADRAWYAEQAKLQYYFSGLAVAYLTGEPEGKVVIDAIDPCAGGVVGCVPAALTPEQRSRVHYCTPCRVDGHGDLIPPLYDVSTGRIVPPAGRPLAYPGAGGHPADAQPLR
jgi:hypothetical protein